MVTSEVPAKLAFVHQSLAVKVVFGVGTLDQVAEEVGALGAKKALVLCTPGRTDLAEDVAGRLGAASVGVFSGAVMHVPAECADAGIAQARSREADCCVAVGGGSTIGLGKAIALQSDLPILAIPTTYSGSEMTPIWGMTRDGIKTTGRDSKVLPRTVIYDPTLTVSLPPHISATSGMNAIAHCVEALYSETANPITSLMAEESIRALGTALPQVVSKPTDLIARAEALYGAWLAGAALGAVGMAIHHKLCHTLGGSFNLPHADVHTVIIPHAAHYNRDAAATAMSRVAMALDGRDGPAALYDLAEKIGAPRALKDIGMKYEDLDRAARLATTQPYFNPMPVTLQGIRALLENAYHGRRPGDNAG